MYALVVGSDGHKLKPSEPAPQGSAEPEPGTQTTELAGQKIQMGANGQSATVSGPDGQSVRVSQVEGKMRMEFGKVSMAQFAETVSRFVDRPVVDATGITGTYQVPLELRQEDLMAMVMVQARAAGVSLPVGALPGTTPGQAAEPTSSSIFESVQKLGLKLDARKMPVDMIVVDAAEKKPTEN